MLAGGRFGLNRACLEFGLRALWVLGLGLISGSELEEIRAQGLGFFAVWGVF